MEELKPTTYFSDEKGIQKLLTAFAEGWNSHDATKFSRVFEEDADFTNVMGISKSGRPAIEALHTPLFQTIWAFSTLRITESKIRFIKPDVAAVDARWTLDGLKDQNGNDRAPRNGLLNFVMTKTNDRWMITVMHNMDLPNSVVQKC